MPVLLPPLSRYDDGIRTGVVGILNRAEAHVLLHEETLPERMNLHCEGALWFWRTGNELFLADGHHRYAAGYNVAMIQTRDASLRSLPSHRVVLKKRGMRLPETEPVGNIALYLETTPADRWRAVVMERGREARGIDIAREMPLQELFRDAVVRPEREVEMAVAAVMHGEAELALLVAAYTVDQIEDYARRGDLLPPKSTDFYPKLRHPFQSENAMPATAHLRGVRKPSS